jgi:type I restriction enzyme S subunit
MSKLPQGWVQKRLGDVLSLHYGKSLPEKLRLPGPYPVYGSNGIIGYHDEALVNAPCIIIGRKGSIGEIRLSEVDCWPIDTTYFVNDFRIFDVSFAKYLLKWLPLSSMNRATAVPGLNREDVLSMEIAIPPFEEQKRIARKIDNLVSKLEHTRSLLKHVSKLTDKYKKAVLEEAFSGRWTDSWRETNANNMQKSNNKRLPKSWKIHLLGNISEIQTGLALGKRRKSSEVTHVRPYIRVANVQRGYLDLSEIKYIPVTEAEFNRLRLIKGDILMNEGGDRDKLGRGWVWNDEIDNCIHQNHVFRMRLKDKNFPSRWVSYYTNEFGQKYFFDKGQQTTNLASISKSKVSALPIPIPPASEAAEIVNRIDAAFMRIARLQTHADKVHTLTDRVYEQILSKALNGELILQNSEDESAWNLIARTQAGQNGPNPNDKQKIRKNNREISTMIKKLVDVLSETTEWLSAQDAFHLCGIDKNATTEEIEPIYMELRLLDEAGCLLVDHVRDEKGRKLYDRIKLNKEAYHAT